MLGVRPRPYSGPGTMCPWIDCGEPIVEELADGPEAVEWLEGAVRISGDSY
jgi:hypothetical protein